MSTGNGAGEELAVEREGRLLVITMNRPQVRNALTPAMARGIAAAIELFDGDPELRVGILTGGGGSFCAGLDLKTVLDGGEREVEGRGFGGLTEAPPRKPLIAAIEGYALAGGFEMALACDLIVAAEDAKLGLPEVKRGLIAGSGGLLRLPRKLPLALAMEISLTGESFGAELAHRWGLVNRLVPPGEALGAARELALSIAANAPLAVQTSKRILEGAAGSIGEEDWSGQRQLVLDILATDDAREGASAFLEKRDPKWKGK